jgi:hypothetical protein
VKTPILDSFKFVSFEFVVDSFKNKKWLSEI